ncbi:Bax inhibitor-1/YccA family protein [Alicyclobacillus mengziensis]|uniref:Bax inhibitor-1/YccA family protein n=1 Tax=Alicyclobacillus mengziensis TaxID=2931921 RepID=A0A9X7Z6P5_9BACL|nr:Bax inhibitor-1/YccA family protein [Alicyclobacillus mengziensis]QSO48199.1 Bax inhibitor-1/YccA family protein [Alicyclobacillus mengziensis]
METYALTRNSVFSRVFFGLAISLVFAFVGVYAGQYVPPTVISLLMFVELLMIFGAMFLRRRRHMGMTFVYLFTFISGITLYPVLAYYTGVLGPATLLKAIGVSAIAFIVAALVASRTSFDFSFLGGFLFIGLIAIVVMGLVSMFIGFSTMAGLIYSLLGIAIFVGYVLFDVNRMAHNGLSDAMVPWMVLSLYLDFINLLLFVLQLLGILGGQSRR